MRRRKKERIIISVFILISLLLFGLVIAFNKVREKTYNMAENQVTSQVTEKIHIRKRVRIQLKGSVLWVLVII